MPIYNPPGLNSPKVKTTFAVVGIIILLINLWMIGSFARICYMSFQSKDWPAIDGTILKSQIYKQRSFKDQFSSSNFLQLEYAYSVADKSYTTDRYLIDTASVSQKEADKFNLENYAVGQMIKVYYDPANPANATLVKNYIPGQARSIAAFWPVLCTFSVLPYVYIFYFIKRYAGQNVEDLSELLIHFGRNLFTLLVIGFFLSGLIFFTVFFMYR